MEVTHMRCMPLMQALQKKNGTPKMAWQGKTQSHYASNLTYDNVSLVKHLFECNKSTNSSGQMMFGETTYISFAS